MTPQLGWTLSDWRKAYQNRTLEPGQALEALRRHLSPRDPVWIYRVSAEELHAQVRQLAERGDRDSLPLYGIPFVIKDNLDAAGMPTTAACAEFSHLAETDAACVARLKAAGAILLAKTNLDQFATGLVGTRSPYGAVPNPFNPDHVSGGSSSGSAVAVSRGLVPFSLGTDTAGSGRVPAGFNNIVGLKPTCGRISTRGLVPACRSLDCVSVFALNVEDAQTVAHLMEGFDPEDAYSRPQPHPARHFPARPRLAIPQQLDWFGDTESEAAWQRSLEGWEALGAELVPMDFTPMQRLAQLLYGGAWVAERLAAIGDFMAKQAEAMNPVVRGIIAQAEHFSASDAFSAEHQRAHWARRIQALMASVDALLVPTAPRLPRIDEVEADPVGINSQLGTWTNFVNLADASALALPAGFRSDGLPFGVTLIAPAWQDAALAELGLNWQNAQAPRRGATDLYLSSSPFPTTPMASNPPVGHIRLAVVGAHLSGMPLNHQLTERHARLAGSRHTSADYRLYALPGTHPAKPGLMRVKNSGQAIALELWDMPLDQFGSFVALVPPPLGIGSLTLEDGSCVKGFICEPWAIEGAEDISDWGGWRAYCAHAEGTTEQNHPKM